MKKGELKLKIEHGLMNLIPEWFDEPIYQAFAKTIVKANINKFDNMIDLITDDSGNVLVDDIINNLSDIQIDLTKYSSLLPNRILLLSKQDIINIIKNGTDN